MRGEEALHHLLHVHAVDAVAGDEALLDTAGGRPAVAPLRDQAQHPGEQTLGTLDAIDDRVNTLGSNPSGRLASRGPQHRARGEEDRDKDPNHTPRWSLRR